MSISEVVQQPPEQAKTRLYWTAQPGLTVYPEFSSDLTAWSPVTNALGAPLSVTTPHGSIQWLEVTIPAADSNAFLRLRR